MKVENPRRSRNVNGKKKKKGPSEERIDKCTYRGIVRLGCKMSTPLTNVSQIH